MKNQFFKSKMIVLVTLLGLSANMISCKKIQELLTFSIANDCNITINSTSPVNLPFNITSPDVKTNSSQEFENNKTQANLVKDVRLKSLQLTITNPITQSFSFLKSIHIYISSASSSEIELASLDNIPATATTIILTPTQAKLDNYIKASSYNLRTEVVTREILTQNVDIKIQSKFYITANL